MPTMLLSTYQEPSPELNNMLFYFILSVILNSALFYLSIMTLLLVVVKILFIEVNIC